MLNRLYIDNCKFFCKNSGITREYNDTIDWSESGFIIKCLRDYAQHRSLPVTNTTITYDVLNEIETTKFTILKKELLQNSFRGKQLEKLKKLEKNEIILNDLIEPYNKEIGSHFEQIVKKFLETIPNNFYTYVKLNTRILLLEHKERRIDTIYSKSDDGFIDKVHKCDEDILHYVLQRMLAKTEEV